MKCSAFAIALAFTLTSAHAAFAQCPAAPDHRSELAELIRGAQVAPDEASAQRLNAEMWALWTDAPDARAQRMLDEGMARREGYDLDGALGEFNALIDYCPDYAEGYNQRAFVHYIRGELEPALKFLDLALERSPQHIGALSGKALTLTGMGRARAGQEALRQALRLNPWLSERHMLIGEMPAIETDL